MVTLYLVRHGQTDANLAGILQGHMDNPMNAAGVRQAEELRDRLVAEGFRADVLLASDLRRTAEMAAILNAGLGLPLRLTARLRERDWGELTGRVAAKTDLSQFPASVETVEAMEARAAGFLEQLCRDYDGRRVLAVTHGLFARCLQGVLAGKRIREIPPMGNGELRRVEVCCPPSGRCSRPAESGAADR